MSSTISPGMAFELAEAAYRSLGASEEKLKQYIKATLGSLIEGNSVKQLNAQSGNISPTTTGFGFITRGKGAHSNDMPV